MTWFNWFNSKPYFTNLSNGQTICINENSTFVVDANACDRNWDALTYSISGGADAARFTINPRTGVLCFVTPPDYEGQNSAIGNDDIYDVTIRVADGRGGFSDLCLYVNVLDVPEPDGVVNGTGGGDHMTLGYTDAQCDQITNNSDSISAGAGNDTVYAASGNDTVDGGAGDDNMFGENGNDVIYGSSGNDSFLGGGGNDTIYGGDGDDQQWAGDGGDDLVYGGNGYDVISGDLGTDTLFGEAGNDAIEGHEGADFVYGGDGDDYIMGADLNYITYASDRTLTQTSVGYDDGSSDTLFGGTGNDTVFGNAGQDQLSGDEGNDYLFGGEGSDTLNGGAGHDSISGDAGADLIYGGDGDDQIVYGAGLDSVYGGAGNDVIDDVPGYALSDAAALIYGGDGNDLAWGTSLGDSMFGDAGNDSLFGEVGNDLLNGGAGNDYLDGGSESDTVVGGEGDDQLHGGDGDDLLIAGGADTANGGSGDDLITLATGEGALDINIQADGGSNGAAGDTLDTSSNSAAQVVTLNTDPSSGVVNGLDGDAGADVTFVGIENIITGAGADLVTGGGNGGAAHVTTGAGDDRVVHNYNPASGSADSYDGGADTDTFVLTFTAAQWATPAVQADVAAYVAHLANGNAAVPFTFASTNATVVNFEVFEVTVNGVTLDPADAAVIANTDSITAIEDGPTSITVDLLANDVVADRAASVQLLSGSSYGTLALSSSLLSTVQTATLVFTPTNGLLQSLPAGQTLTETLTYRVTDVDGSFADASVVITITGTNDLATITGLAAGTTTEDALAAITGSLSVTDVDAGEAAFQSPANLVGTYGTFTFNAATGAWGYTPNASTLALESLAVGTQVSDSLTVTSIDGTASETIVVTITGENDAPTLTAAVLGAVEDGPAVTLDLASLGDDVDSDDDGSTLTYAITGAPAVGTASISGTTLTFNGGAGLDGLAQGEELVTTISITATDAHGATATSTVEVTITGTNDALTLTAAVLGAVEDGPAVTLDLASLGDDVDSDDDASTLTYTISGAPSVGTATITGTTLTFNGGAGLDSLAQGEELVATISITATDAHGAAATSTVEVTITGTNDAPYPDRRRSGRGRGWASGDAGLGQLGR
ncbi:MAG: VCBS domain-containing protein [Cypionkella sp.]|nr:VCBS domain-containing protein [Cypionkella sp.]